MTVNQEQTSTMRSPAIVFAMTGAAGLHGGIAVVNLNIIIALVAIARAHNVLLTVLAYHEKDDDRPASLPDGVEYRAFRSNRYAMAMDLWRRSSDKPLFVFDHVNVARALLPLALLGHSRTAIFAHGWENWRTVKWTDSWSLRSAERVLANSEFTRKKIKARFPNARVAACPLGLHPGFHLNVTPPGPASEPLSLPDCNGVIRQLGQRVLLLAARMDPTERQKGHLEVLAVLPRVLAQHPGVQLVFTGSGGDHENLVSEVRRLHLGSQVFLPGQVAVTVLQALFRQCYAFVMPSTQEGFGLVYLEAMNAAKPCLGCFDQGTEDVIEHGVTGVLVRDPRNQDELAGAILGLLDDAEGARAMGQRGFERLHTLFTAEKFRERFTTQINEILA